MRKLHKVIFTGDRNFKTKYAVAVVRELDALIEQYGTDDLLVIQGGAPGVDTLVKKRCKKKNVHCAEIEALWDTRKRGAGPQRNEIMILLDPHEVIGIHDNIAESRGTRGMLELARQYGVVSTLHDG